MITNNKNVNYKMLICFKYCKLGYWIKTKLAIEITLKHPQWDTGRSLPDQATKATAITG